MIYNKKKTSFKLGLNQDSDLINSTSHLTAKDFYLDQRPVQLSRSLILRQRVFHFSLYQ